MSGYIKYFDNGGKNMSFVTDDKEAYGKYDEIWNVVKSLLKLKVLFFITIIKLIVSWCLENKYNKNFKGI